MTLKNVIIATDHAQVNGGQTKVAIDTARLLADAGIEVAFFAAVPPVAKSLHHPRIRLEILEQADILSEKNRALAAARGIWNRTAARRLRALAAEFDPATTVLHTHGFIKALSASIGPVLTSGPLPSVFTMHDYFLACPNGGFFDYQRNEICSRKAMGFSCLTTNCDARKPVHKAWRVARQAVISGPGRMPRGFKDVICISETQRRILEPYLGKETRLHHVPNPVDMDGSAASSGRAKSLFVFVGRLSPEKGGLLFAEAAKVAGVKAVFVGDGPDAAEIRIRYPEFEVTGWVEPSEVQSWIGRAKVLVFPSLWREPFGLVALEALGRGVPVVAGAWNAAAEIVRDGENGVIFDTPTVESLVAALHRVDNVPPVDPAPYRTANSPAAHLDRLMEVYDQVLADQAKA